MGAVSKASRNRSSLSASACSAAFCSVMSVATQMYPAQLPSSEVIWDTATLTATRVPSSRT